jgi:hypothetical protein
VTDRKFSRRYRDLRRTPTIRERIRQSSIAVDLDGVLCHGFGDYASRAPDLEQIERVRELHGLGWRVVVWTARRWSMGAQRETEAWLRRHGVPFDHLALGKPVFDAIVDDRADRELPADLEAWSARALGPGRLRGPEPALLARESASGPAPGTIGPGDPQEPGERLSRARELERPADGPRPAGDGKP